MIDHVSLRVSDLEKSKKFYKAVLQTVGYALDSEYSDACGFHKVDDGADSFWLVKEDYITKGAHVAFLASDRKVVENFHAVGITAGGEDNGKPGLRPDYGPDYFGAFLLDPDGNNIEAVTRN